MSRLLTIGALALAACAFDGAAGGPGGVDGGAIDAPRSVPDAVVDAEVGNPDVDGDGIDNEQDNCPELANPNQENEDGDSFGNACDRCPIIDDGDVEQLDGDGDGIGDDCDPQPGEQNSVVFFEGFDAALDPDLWSGEGAWNVDAAAGVIRRSANDARSYLLRTNVGGDDNILVVAEIDFDNENAGSPFNFRFGGVVSQVSNGGDNHQGCWLVRESDDDEFFGIARNTNANLIGDVSNAAAVVENDRYTISHRIQSTNHTCAFVRGANNLSLPYAGRPTLSGDDVGVVASFVTANLYYLYAIRLQ